MKKAIISGLKTNTGYRTGSGKKGASPPSGGPPRARPPATKVIKGARVKK